MDGAFVSLGKGSPGFCIKNTTSELSLRENFLREGFLYNRAVKMGGGMKTFARLTNHAIMHLS